MKFYVMGMQPSTEKALSLSSKVFDNLQEALHYRDTVSVEESQYASGFDGMGYTPREEK